MLNLNASKTRSVPNHAYFALRRSSDGPNASAWRRRSVLLTPSAATTRSNSSSRPAPPTSAWKGRATSRPAGPRRGGVGRGLEDVEQVHARERREAVAAAREHLAAVVDVDLGPAREAPGDLVVGLAVGGLERGQRLVGEHDAEAERVVGRVALVDRHLVRRVELLEQDRQVEPGGPTADDRGPHRDGTL